MKKPDPQLAEADAKTPDKLTSEAKASAASLLDATPVATGDAPRTGDGATTGGATTGTDKPGVDKSGAKPVDSKPPLPKAEANPAMMKPADKPTDKPNDKPTEIRPATSTPPTPPRETVKVVERRGGFFPMMLGGAVAAGLGAGAMYYALPQLPEAWRPAGLSAPAPAPVVDTAAVEAAAVKAAEAAAAAQLAPANEQIAALTQQLAALKAAPVAAGGEGVPAALVADLQALKTQLQGQAQQLQQLAARPAAAGGEAIAGLQAEAQQIVAQVQQQAQAAQGQIAAAQDQAKALMAEAEAAAQRAQGQGALASLQAAMQTGAPVAAPVAALAEAGVAVPQQIASGEVPQLDALRADFPDAARAALAAVAAADAANQGVLDRVGSFLRVQTGARTVGGPREGSDPDAILSRAEAALGASDVAGAMAEVATLPDPGQQAMAEWTTRARAWVAAQEAVAQIAETLN